MKLCCTCDHFEPVKDSARPNTEGECRCQAPLPEKNIITRWPEVDGEKRCGEWTPIDDRKPKHCGDCAFFVPYQSSSDGKYGRCFESPPVVIPASIQETYEKTVRPENAEVDPACADFEPRGEESDEDRRD